MTNVNTPILNLTLEENLTGAESVPMVQGGVTKRTTTAAIAGFSLAGTFANNAAALAGGLSIGQFYKTAAGEVRVVV